MHTIRIETKSTTKFAWSSSGARGLGERVTKGLREAVVEAIDDFRDYASTDGQQAGIHACLVTWQDGDELRAFIFSLADQLSAEIPWTLMSTQVEGAYRRSK